MISSEAEIKLRPPNRGKCMRPASLLSTNEIGRRLSASHSSNQINPNLQSTPQNRRTSKSTRPTLAVRTSPTEMTENYRLNNSRPKADAVVASEAVEIKPDAYNTKKRHRPASPAMQDEVPQKKTRLEQEISQSSGKAEITNKRSKSRASSNTSAFR
jgi:hypothetical protein